MKTRSKQVAVGVLAFTAAYVGFWAQLAPESFFRSFPLTGHPWLPVLGPYNEHLIRDVGGLYLALLVVSVWAAVRPETATLRVAGAAWLVFSVPHVAFHAFHLDTYGTADKIGNVVSLGGVVVLAALLLLPSAPGSDDPARETTDPVKRGPTITGCRKRKPD